MFVTRPAREEDLDTVVALVQKEGYGLTSLPKDAELLRERLAQSVESFSRSTDRPGGESYLLVLEDGESRRVMGTSGITSKVGGFEPFYTYRIETHVYQSQVLQSRKEVACLHLLAEHDGPCEIGSLYLAPRARGHGNGRLLSLSRFVYMAEHPHRFEREVIAEMRGVVDDQGRSPFWEAIGRHFFDIDFPKADYLSAKDKRFIAELMPDHPIYIPLLPEEARAAVGEVHPETRPALRLLREEGFRIQAMVDIFDGGPVVACPLREIRTVKESRSSLIVEVEEGLSRGSFLVARSVPEFRACLADVRLEAGGVALGAEAARALEVGRGDRVRWAPARPGGGRVP